MMDVGAELIDSVRTLNLNCIGIAEVDDELEISMEN